MKRLERLDHAIELGAQVGVSREIAILLFDVGYDCGIVEGYRAGEKAATERKVNDEPMNGREP